MKKCSSYSLMDIMIAWAIIEDGEEKDKLKKMLDDYIEKVKTNE